ncbi:MAG: FimB/Mfa2 family fimbrial subunit [Bacteroides sp.]|nr:FimB/Mfa2 family fimbrial subunit [Bacteroides sp.]
MFALLSLAACTFDYFKDDTNYQVFVPEVLSNSITDCRVLVYNEAGDLVGARYETAPWGRDPRVELGLFSFRLARGNYKVYCYTNADSLLFVDEQCLETSAFKLKSSPTGENRYVHPSDLLFQKLQPEIIHEGILKIDTVQFERYTGRITVRFENFPGDVSRIKKVKMLATGAAVAQYLKNDTLTSRFTPEDKMFHFDALPPQTMPGIMEVDHRFLPSVENEAIRLNYTFLDDDGTVINQMAVAVSEKNTGIPLRLLHGRRIIIEIDSYTIVKISVVGWNDDIENGNTNLE